MWDPQVLEAAMYIARASAASPDSDDLVVLCEEVPFHAQASAHLEAQLCGRRQTTETRAILRLG